MTDAKGTYHPPLPPESESVSAQPTAATSPYKPPALATARHQHVVGSPAGLKIRGPHDEHLVIFRKALGINFHRDCAEECTLEEGRKSAIGIYKIVIMTHTRKRMQHAALTAFLYTCYFAQIVIGAALTALGAGASTEQGLLVITALGALNTVLAGILALIKGSGQPQKLGRDRVEYRKLQSWIEETEALLAVGVIGRNRMEVGLLVEYAFKRYNAAMASDENNQADIEGEPEAALGYLSPFSTLTK
ncbi:hypothetical protein DL771_006277 [Monosporascus sp. 5C6A]|nr:hypothetical protein DL771_006277 [Monosporascus sp. 5C6A]